ncbi:MAG: anaerobic ribonucleoside-triphosphate reductase activating protein [Lachnospiraceae bacterium]|nr:anaerobic ribonucleoside-triphosphate reductase activating protein [Lachnospiraceae bacterium]
MRVRIYGYTQLTLLDYPGKLASTVFVGGCNYRCPYCHNADLVAGTSNLPLIPESSILRHILKRKNALEGVCITGGEPTLYNDLPQLIGKIKDIGLLVKLDTNGTNPAMVKYLHEQGLIDYVAMDIKAAPSNYPLAVGLGEVSMSEVFETVEFLLKGKVDYEFRTTVVEGIHTLEDFEKIGKWISGAKRYFLQTYKKSDKQFLYDGLETPSKEKMTRILDVCRKHVPSTVIRGEG